MILVYQTQVRISAIKILDIFDMIEVMQNLTFSCNHQTAISLAAFKTAAINAQTKTI